MSTPTLTPARVEQLLHHADNPGGVQHVQRRVAVGGGDPDRGVLAGGGGAPDQQRLADPAALHLGRQVH
ncbi:MAG: hypothetical protein WAK82_42310, partial [Streptosporangiaceae bacterium]